MKSNGSKYTYYGLDIFKYIAACLVVILHVVEIEDIFATGVVYICTRFAVPFFFIASGYLFYRGLASSNVPSNYLKKYLKKLIILFIFWGVIVYGSFTIRDYFIGQSNNGFLKNIFLSLRRIFIIGPCSTWYLLSLLLSVLFLYFLYKTNKIKLIILMVAICFCLNFFYINYQSIGFTIKPIELFNNTITIVFSNENNFLLMGIPFTGLGFLFAHYNARIRINFSVVLFILASLTTTIEYIVLVCVGKTITIGYAFQAVFFFFFAISISRGINRSKELRQASTVTYLFHWLLLYEIINPILKLIGINPYQLFLLPVKVLVTVVICYCVFVIVKRTNNKWLKLVFGV